MVRALVLSDAHISRGNAGFDDAFLTWMRQNLPDLILCAGNLGPLAALQALATYTPKIHVVQGDCDSFAAPERLLMRVDDVTIGMLHGYQLASSTKETNGTLTINSSVLQLVAADIGVDLLIVGGPYGPRIHQVSVASKTCFIILPGCLAGPENTFTLARRLERERETRLKPSPPASEEEQGKSSVSLAYRGPSMIAMDISRAGADVYELILDPKDTSKVQIGDVQRLNL
ncbi:similar to retromer component VPS29 [Cyanidioschyzon merolae strain 10D]|jgi:putative phosphoesterase|uniref:Vacuolar protein sorting-associated protein 29 n=1 Tax=Cyanidioschyzon merolae (strain NIES-3377 / 10D) TaxID=280699 RepID=M1V6X2_CYAM1|nr:similar to retromer component VPS29 [Cyanidioschyzon merolae strain 10D]BAM82590.1 similar to retromer component VPS29 [Cyanidioschyzon merolae strain 10D]|eukprot:XP_005538626.1 similar to retromer component VPS29 [Cyanidioschyzon merolae strain 10D]